jgi:hypothetical protein
MRARIVGFAISEDFEKSDQGHRGARPLGYRTARRERHARIEILKMLLDDRECRRRGSLDALVLFAKLVEHRQAVEHAHVPKLHERGERRHENNHEGSHARPRRNLFSRHAASASSAHQFSPTVAKTFRERRALRRTHADCK